MSSELDGRPRFSLGRVVSTPGARSALEEAGQSTWGLLNRHVRGDWGEVGQEDWRANDRAVSDPERLLSAYRLNNGGEIWVITETDRSVTTLLLPDEY